MCVTCGCSDDSQVTLTDMKTGVKTAVNHHHHSHTLADGTVITHSHDHHDDHHHSSTDTAHIHAKIHGNTISLEQNILRKNDLIAAQNRGWFKGRNILALNLVSSPGSGKTT